MSIEIRVPPLGESLVEATVGRWRKQEGEPVQRGDLLVDLETEKINLEVEAEESGVLQQIARREGETVQVGEVLAVLGPGAGRPQTAPSARQIAAEKEVDLSQVAGSGRGGRVSGEDVRAFLEAGVGRRTSGVGSEEGRPSSIRDGDAEAVPTSASPPREPESRPVPTRDTRYPTPDREERVRLSRRRLTIARRLVEAQQTAAILTTFNEVDMSAVMELRRRRKESFQERHGVGLGLMSFFTRAAVGALKAFPVVNAEMQGEELVLKHYYDIGVAVATEQGLVVPVLRDADRKSFAEIEREIAELARRARENQLTPQDLIGGTFTLTNGGVFGSLLSTPILNPPQVGILGMHTIQQRPVAVEGQVVIRPMMYVALSYDHRVIDGREAVQFLVRVKQLVEDPEVLLLEG